MTNQSVLSLINQYGAVESENMLYEYQIQSPTYGTYYFDTNRLQSGKIFGCFKNPVSAKHFHGNDYSGKVNFQYSNPVHCLQKFKEFLQEIVANW